MIGRACAVRRLTPLARCPSSTIAAPPSAWAKKLTLPQLLEMARGNPGLQASAAAASAPCEAQVIRGEAELVAAGRPAVDPGAVARTSVASPSDATTASETTSARGTLRRVVEQGLHPHRGEADPADVRLRQDLGRHRRGRGGRRRSSQQREAGARADVELNVRKAYYGHEVRARRASTCSTRARATSTTPRRSWRRISRAARATSASPTSCACAPCAPSWTPASSRRSALQGIARDSLRTLLGSEAPDRHRRRRRGVRAARGQGARPSPTTRISRRRTGPRCGCSSTPSRRSPRSPISSGARSIPTSC